MSLDPTLCVEPQRARFTGWDVLRLALLILIVALVSAAALVGSWASSFADLQRDLDSGRVHSVLVAEGLPARAEGGYAGQEIRWRVGLRHKHATVVQVSPGMRRPADAEPHAVVLHRDVGAWLEDRHPGLRVARGQQALWGASLLGWDVPSWVGAGSLFCAIGWLVLLVSGPQPWRATRWAWFWLGTNPLGLVAFLLLSGPTPPLPAPRNPSRRLTGGWAFLLAILLGGILGAPRP